MSSSITAPAKVNLFLEILRKRPDGYHEIATLMVPIGLSDELHFTPSDSFTLTCDEPALSTGDDNLIVKAAELLRRETGCTAGAQIHLKKRIPWAAGLGGGSSDAAAALKGLDRLWNLKLSRTDLLAFAAQLGSDVPFFLDGRPAWCTGRGEILEPLSAPSSEMHLLLICPPTGCSTAEVYRRLKVPAQPIDGSAAKEALIRGTTRDIAAALFNRLQEPAFEVNPQVAAVFECLKRTSAAGCLMSGSGSSLFALADGPDHLRAIGGELNALPLPAGTRCRMTESSGSGAAERPG